MSRTPSLEGVHTSYYVCNQAPSKGPFTISPITLGIQVSRKKVNTSFKMHKRADIKASTQLKAQPIG